jgi:Gluconate 2-dehydrogenase subunit 3
LDEPLRIDRRTTLKWVLGAAAALPYLKLAALAAPGNTGTGYGTDPNLMRQYQPGELWRLILTPAQRRSAGALCDVIIPADDNSPSASSVGVVDFIDEWLSAPYPDQVKDRSMILTGLADLETDAQRRFGKGLPDLTSAEQRALCDPICYVLKADAEHQDAAVFFARFRDLTAGAFYTTPLGTKDLGYVGNVALAHFDGPPLEVLKRAGLA